MGLSKSLVAAAFAVASFSANANLLSNGSFESGLSGWTPIGAASYPFVVIPYGSVAAYPNGAFGESVSADNSASLSPDAAGTHAVYFVSDNATETLSQSFTVGAAGDYNVGFSTYATANGMRNAGNASFSATVDGNVFYSTLVGSLTAQNWQAQSSVLNLGAGTHNVTFTFATGGGVSKDLLIDRAFVAAVPEPETYAMLLAGLGLVGWARRRQAKSA